MDYRIQKIVSKIETNATQKVNILECAKSVNLSLSRLQHLFKREVGVGICEFSRRLRLRNATDLLESTDLRIKEICVKVGASSSSHFLREFREFYGLSPSEFRLRHRSYLENQKQNLLANNTIGY